MKKVYTPVLTLLLCFFFAAAVQAQGDMQQRVERYLYTNYNSNKASLRENERLIRMLEERLDAYLVSVDKETQRLATTQEKEVKQLLLQIEKTRDSKVLKEMIDASHTKNIAALDRFINKGLSTPQDALDCRKIIVMKLVENELISQRQEKLLALLKDDHSRAQFIQGMLKKGDVQENEDMKTFTKAVEIEVDGYHL